MKTYSSYYGTTSLTGDIQRVINNNATDNLTWGMEMINDYTRRLVSKYYLNERTYTTTTVSGTQFYNLPPQVKELVNLTITIGGVLWQPKPCPTRQMWDNLNVISFNQDYPSYFFVYNGQVGIFPKPASNGNTITMNYKTRMIDLSMADVTDTSSAQTMTATNGSTTLTASGSVFLSWMAGQWIKIPFPNGDNNWYQIDTISSATVALLKNKYTGATASGLPFTIGQVSLLPEDYQDLPLYMMGYTYYTTRMPDATRASLYQKLWADGEARLNAEFGQKTASVVLQDSNPGIINPNLFQSSLTQN